MSKFNYTGTTTTGKKVKGSITSNSLRNARSKLLRQGLNDIKLKPAAGGELRLLAGEQSLIGDILYRDKSGSIQIQLGMDKPTSKDIVIFTKQLGTMVSSGVSLLLALEILKKQQQSRLFAFALDKIKHEIESGASLSEGLALYPVIFDKLYLAMMKAGEKSGNLDNIIKKLISYIERAEKIKSQVKTAMMYPAVVICVSILVVTGLLVYIVPIFAKQFQSAGQQLPAITQMVMNVSHMLTNNWPWIIASIILAAIGLKMILANDTGKEKFDHFLLLTPIIGVLIKKIAVGRFCSTLSSMISSGVNLLEALTICASSAGNKTIEKFVLNARRAIEQGEKLSTPLSQGHLFPEMVVSMIAIGESTGALDEMLEKVSEFYDEEVDEAVKGLLSVIEPIMIVVLGGIIAFVVIALYLPIFNLAGTVG